MTNMQVFDVCTCRASSEAAAWACKPRSPPPKGPVPLFSSIPNRNPNETLPTQKKQSIEFHPQNKIFASKQAETFQCKEIHPNIPKNMSPILEGGP